MASNTQSEKLSAIVVKNAKPKEKTYKLADGKGLNLEVRPNGSKYWRLSYRYQQKQKMLALGVYPVVTLKRARELTLEAKQLLHRNVDPAVKKKRDKYASGTDTFKFIADLWFKKESGLWSKDHATKVWKSLEVDAFPDIGFMPVKDIRTSDILSLIRKIEGRGALDVASRIKQRIRSVLRYAIQTDVIEFNVADALEGVIRTRKVQHRKALKLDELTPFLNALDEYSGYTLTKYALQLIIHTFVRPGELRSAEWKDIDMEKAIWRIPPEKMKMKEEHLVPLSKQALSVLETVKELTGKHDLVFPGVRDRKKQMSENTLTYAIRKRLGYDATAHGFRTTASTMLNEQGFRVDVIERQLAHGDRNKIRAAYNRSQYLDERKDMMQWYSDHIESLKTGTKIISIYRAKA